MQVRGEGGVRGYEILRPRGGGEAEFRIVKCEVARVLQVVNGALFCAGYEGLCEARIRNVINGIDLRINIWTEISQQLVYHQVRPGHGKPQNTAAPWV